MQKNENRPGYKRTKVGWIPEGWDLCPLSKICDLQSGKFIEASAIAEEKSDDSYPCFGGNGMRGFVDSYSHEGDYPLIGRQGALCGNVCWGSGKFYATEHAVVATPTDSTSPKWLYFQLGHLNLNKYATGVAQPGLSVKMLNTVSASVPSPAEQEGIAGVLECWDKSIRTLEKKIEKKRLIKKGLMQKLLSGKVRLPGFSKPWKTVMLGEVSTIKTGKKDVNQGNPNGQHPFFTCAKTHTYSDEYSFDTEAILIAGNGEVGHCQYYCGKFEAYQRTYVLHNFDSIDAQFLFCCLRHFFQAQVEQQKQMGAMPYIKLGMLTDFELPLPSLEEQQAIAEVLSAADGEIEALEKKLLLWKDQKKYLLNNLVTGTIRLPEFCKGETFFARTGDVL